MTAPWHTPARRRGSKSFSPLCHQENGNVLFRFQCLMCWQSPNSTAQSLVKFSHESWSCSTLGPATFRDTCKGQASASASQKLLPTHNVAVTFQRGGDAVKGDTDHYTHHRRLWGTLRYTDLDLNPRKGTAGTVPNLWLLNHRTHSLLALGNVSSHPWPPSANCRRSHSLHFWTLTRTMIISYFSFIFPLHFFLHIFVSLYYTYFWTLYQILFLK